MSLIRNEIGYYEIDPKPTSEELGRYYNDKYYRNRDGTNQYSYEYTPDELVHKSLPGEEALYFVPEHASSLFEVGVGEGFMLKFFADRGWSVRGVDFTSDGLDEFFPELRDRLVTGDVSRCLAEEFAAGNTYDLVICNHVLEHVIDPPGILEDLHRIVADDGLCRIQVPNDGSWLQAEVVARGAAEPEYWLCPPDHLSYFTRPTLSKLLERHGWKIVDILADFPVDLFLLNPDSRYTRDKSRGRNCHFARVAFELALRRHSLEALIAFRRGCSAAGVGRCLNAYVTHDR